MQQPAADMPQAPDGPVLLVTGRGTRMRMRTLNFSAVGEATDLDLDKLADLILPTEDPTEANRTPMGGRVVVPDQDTFRELVDNCEAQGGGHLMRALEVAQALPLSTRVVVLADALSRKFFIPNDLDVSDLGDWSTAFRLDRPKAVSNLPVLYRAVCWAEEGGNPHGVDVARDEARLICGASYSSLAAQCSLFARVDALTTAYEFLFAADPLGRDRARIDGTVFDATLASSKHVLVDGSFTAKEGRNLVALPPDGFPQLRTQQSALGRLLSIESEPDGFLMEVGMSPAMYTLLAEGEPVSMMAEPFLFGATKKPGPRWVVGKDSPEAAPRVFRDVPLSVSFAGAPVEAGAAA